MVLAKKWGRPWRGYAENGRVRLDNRAINPPHEHHAELRWLAMLPEAIRELVGSLLEVTEAADDARFNDPLLVLDVQNARAVISVWKRRGEALYAIQNKKWEEANRANQAEEEAEPEPEPKEE